MCFDGKQSAKSKRNNLTEMWQCVFKRPCSLTPASEAVIRHTLKERKKIQGLFGKTNRNPITRCSFWEKINWSYNQCHLTWTRVRFPEAQKHRRCPLILGERKNILSSKRSLSPSQLLCLDGFKPLYLELITAPFVFNHQVRCVCVMKLLEKQHVYWAVANMAHIL